ncbi:Hypothetical predicted protein [Olea europaea subsp. europaea]|uniref:Uncharacterized protein n=1 Tax=Olea europaea subsp. europaea TaxID=158383 RepID=A0A8S0V9S1_OLEEU|nr:Hypothetical predicted protein [Olea europaea subsp. europaea]
MLLISSTNPTLNMIASPVHLLHLRNRVQVLGTRNDQYGILSGCFGIFGKCSAPTVSVLLASSHPQQSPNSSTLLAGK